MLAPSRVATHFGMLGDSFRFGRLQVQEMLWVGSQNKQNKGTQDVANFDADAAY